MQSNEIHLAQEQDPAEFEDSEDIPLASFAIPGLSLRHFD